jgi:hypothetical protein
VNRWSERERRDSLTRIFYSHAKKIYGTPVERRQISLIKSYFPPDSVVVDPGSDDNVPRTAEREMQYFLGMVEQSDCVVFSRHIGVVTSGVMQEVNYALSKGKPVYEIRGGRRIVPLKRTISRSSKVDALLFIITEAVQRIFSRT